MAKISFEVDAMLKIFLLSLLSLSLYAEVVGGIAILVENEPVTLHEVAKAMRDNSIGADEAVKMLVRQKLEEVEAQKRGISVTSQELSDEIQKMARQNNMSVMEFYNAVEKSQKTSEAALKARIRAGMLNQKLYNAIAFSQMEQPTPEEEEEYYRTHKDAFSMPQGFIVLAYRSSSKDRLKQKVGNPMLYAPDVKSERVVLKVSETDPRLVQLLNETKENTFTPVLPEGNGFVSFFVQEKTDIETAPLEKVRAQITNILMGEKREQVLNDYFSRLQLTADVKVLRLPQ